MTHMLRVLDIYPHLVYNQKYGKNVGKSSSPMEPRASGQETETVETAETAIFSPSKTPRCTGIAFPGCYLLKKATVKLLSGSTEQYNLMIKEKARKTTKIHGEVCFKNKVGEMSSDENHTRIPTGWE